MNINRQVARRMLHKAGMGVVLAIILIFFFIVAGGLAYIVNPTRQCEGEGDIPVGNATTYWEIAQREYPDIDPRAMSSLLLDYNGGDYDALHGSSIKGPIAC